MFSPRALFLYENFYEHRAVWSIHGLVAHEKTICRHLIIYFHNHYSI